MVYFIAFLLSGISMLYEFTLAQLISLFFGSTFEIYALTIGLYTFSLGLGALYYEKVKSNSSSKKLFFKTELALSLVALLSPFVIIFASTKESIQVLGMFAKILAFVPVVACGWLSGIELPCLISMSVADEDHEIIFVDFAGMFLGSVLFSTIFIDFLGPMTLVWSLALTNVVAVLLYMCIHAKDFSRKQFVMGLTSMFITGLCLLNETSLIAVFKELHSV